MKSQAKEKKQGSVTRLLLERYLAFSVLAFFILLMVSVLSSLPVEKAAFYPNVDGLIQKISAMQDMELSRLDYRRYLGEASDFIVLDETRTVLYASTQTQYGDYLARELECIPAYYGAVSSVSVLENSQSDAKYLILQSQYNGNGAESFSAGGGCHQWICDSG